MAVTQTVEFVAEQGLQLSAQLFAVGSDTVVATAASVTAQTNRKIVYRAAFADVAAGLYQLIATSGGQVVASWYAALAPVTGTYLAHEYAQVIALAILKNRQKTDPSTGVMTVYHDDDVTALLTASLYEDAEQSRTYRGKGAEVRNRLA